MRPWIIQALGAAGFVTITSNRVIHSIKSFRERNRLDGIRSAIIALLMGLIAAIALWGLVVRIV